MSISDPNARPSEPGQPQAPSLNPSSTTAVLEHTEEQKAPGDDERFAHYVRKDRIVQSAVEGGPVVALCGKVWTPVRNPDKYPLCPTCKAIYEQMGNMGNSWPFGPNVPGKGGSDNGAGGEQ
ncbi:DUF3039 domain-containing protein [Arcanobacterium phocae]|uniref:DUF3039 domain-containing protein n=1 Tax=Arcanobacterium phocae TaxID=131112 RepID=UPI001C0EBF41|nr:DUF3039 domain-containing protein [Arcanobacterium phocae]